MALPIISPAGGPVVVPPYSSTITALSGEAGGLRNQAGGGGGALSWDNGPFYIDWDEFSLASDIDPTTHSSGLVEGASNAGGFNIEANAYTGGPEPTVDRILRGDSGSFELVFKIPEINLQAQNLQIIDFHRGTTDNSWSYYMLYHSSGVYNSVGTRRARQYMWNSNENVRVSLQNSNTGSDLAGSSNPYLTAGSNGNAAYWQRIYQNTDWSNNRWYFKWNKGQTVYPQYITCTSPGLSSAGVSTVDRIRLLWGSSTYHATYPLEQGPIYIGNAGESHAYDSRWGAI